MTDINLRQLGCISQVYKHRTVPYVMQEALEEELSRMEHKDILENVSTTEWATPLVCIR